jgi:protein-disulfide isomerase
LWLVNGNTEEIKTLVEFYSFTCSHCASVNKKLETYIASHNIKYLDVNVDTRDEAVPTSLMYYIAIDAGVGSKFKSAYFSAIASGMPAYTSDTLKYVVNQIQNPKLVTLLNDKTEQQKVSQKLQYANSLIAKYHIQVTPTFLINQSTLLEGEEVINQLSQR